MAILSKNFDQNYYAEAVEEAVGEAAGKADGRADSAARDENMDMKRTLGINAVYTFSSAASLVLNMLLLPIYTKYLSRDQVGSLTLASSVQSFVSIFVVLCVYSGMSRFFSEAEDKNRLKNAVLTFSLVWGTVFLAAGQALGPFISGRLFGDAVNGRAYFTCVMVNSLLSAIVSVYLVYYSMQYKAVKNSIFKIGVLMLTLLFSSFFVIILKKDVLGILQAQLLANGLTVIVLLISDIRNIKFCFDRQSMKRILKYSLGLLPGNVSAWVLTLLDRYFIHGMISLSAVAVYSVGCKFGMMMNPLLIEPHSSFFTPYKFDVCKSENCREKIREQYMYYNTMAWLLIACLSLFSSPAVRLLTTGEYLEAYRLVPIIAFAYYLMGLSNFYCVGLHYENKMLINSMITAAGAAANIILNLLLIRPFGIYGAAIATVLSFAAALILYFFAGKKFYDIGVGLLKPWKQLMIFGLVYVVYLALKTRISGILQELLLGAAMLVLYIILSVCFKQIPADKIKKLIGMLRDLSAAVIRKVSNLKKRFTTVVYGYHLELRRVDSDSLEIRLLNSGFEFCCMDEGILDGMYSSYRSEIDEHKYLLLKNRLLPGSNVKGFAVKDERGRVCGYAHIAFDEIFDSCVNKTLYVEGRSMHIFDAYTFRRFRRQGVHSAIYRGILLSGIDLGLDTATVNIISGNTPAERVCAGMGFKKFRKYMFFHLLFLKWTIVREV